MPVFPKGKLPKIDYLVVFPEKFNEKFKSLTLIRNDKQIIIEKYEDRNKYSLDNELKVK